MTGDDDLRIWEMPEGAGFESTVSRFDAAEASELQLRTYRWSSILCHRNGWSSHTSGHLLDGDIRWEVTKWVPPRKCRPGEARPGEPDCRVYWGSHGCCLVRGHDGPHMCECAWDDDNRLLPHADESDNGNVGCAPYYGPDTRFYGEDAEALGLPS